MKAYEFRIVVELVEIDEFGGRTVIDDASAASFDPARVDDCDAKDIAAAVRATLDIDAVVAKVRK